jgi:hypothetical protein
MTNHNPEANQSADKSNQEKLIDLAETAINSATQKSDVVQIVKYGAKPAAVIVKNLVKAGGKPAAILLSLAVCGFSGALIIHNLTEYHKVTHPQPLQQDISVCIAAKSPVQ